MIKFSKKTHYAMVALMHLRRCGDGEQGTAREISARYGFPEDYLGKVLQKMVKAGLVESIQGARGGYRLTRAFEDLSVGCVVSAMKDLPTVKPAVDPSHAACADDCTCYVETVLEDVQLRVMDYLKTLRLDELLAEQLVELT